MHDDTAYPAVQREERIRDMAAGLFMRSVVSFYKGSEPSGFGMDIIARYSFAAAELFEEVSAERIKESTRGN